MTDEKKLRPIDVDALDLETLKKKATDLPGLMEYAHSVGGFAIEPTKQGAIKSKAMAAMREQTKDQLDLIMEQMKLLARQAQQLKERVEISDQIYEATLKFEPVIGQIYYLYAKGDGERVLSLIAPEEWGASPRYEHFVAKVKLLSDHTWKVLDAKDAR